MLIGNKSDLEAQREVTHEEAQKFAAENGKIFLKLVVEYIKRTSTQLFSKFTKNINIKKITTLHY